MVSFPFHSIFALAVSSKLLRSARVVPSKKSNYELSVRIKFVVRPPDLTPCRSPSLGHIGCWVNAERRVCHTGPVVESTMAPVFSRAVGGPKIDENNLILRDGGFFPIRQGVEPLGGMRCRRHGAWCPRGGKLLTLVGIYLIF